MKIKYLFFLFILIFFGCDDSPDDKITIENPNKPETNVQVYLTNGTLFTGNGVVNATIVPWDVERWTVQAGTITSGILNFSFPEAIPSEKLQLVLGSYDYPNAFIIPENTRWCGTLTTFRYPFIVYNSIGEKLGQLKYGKIIMDGSDYVADTVYYWYFDKDVKITGFFSFPINPEIPIEYRFNQI